VTAPFAAVLTTVFGAGVPTARADAEVSFGVGSRVAVLATARHREARDYSSPDGTVSNSAWEDQGGLVRATAHAGGWWTGTWQGDFVGESGLPRSDVATLRVSSPFERSQRGSFAFERSGTPLIDHLAVMGLYSRYEHRLDQDRLPVPGRPRQISRADIEGTDVQVRVVARTGLATSRRLTTGVDYTERHDLTAHDITMNFNAAGLPTTTIDNTSIASARRNDAAVFGQLELPLRAWLTATAGVRFDWVRSVNEGGYFGDRTTSHDAASGSAALAVRPSTRLTVTAQFSSGFRDPTLSDRFYRGPVGRGFIIGNPDLQPERSHQFDLTARYDRGRWRANATYYHYDVSDLIERYQSGPDTFMFRNRGLAEIRGVELEAQIDLTPDFMIEVAGQSGRGRVRDDGAGLDDIAPRSLIVQARHTFGTRVSATARVAVFAEDSTPGPSEVSTPAYVEVGATASWQTTRWLLLRVTASNLANQRYFSSPSTRGVLAAGRNGAFIATLKF
jgi:outer membrane receptor protein involved in Fe transport